MTAVSARDCIGLWRRVLLVPADGPPDTSTDVLWLQGPTGYVDTRGFAGTLSQSADVFSWRRDVDTHPNGLPDDGRMRWEGTTLVETGVHERYTEHWVREVGPVEPAGALFLSAGPQRAVAVRVGDLIGWATAAGAVVADANRMQAWQCHEDHVVADGVCWTITAREGAITP
ncbi:hypothetical protein [Mycobacterium sp. PSTR-4-N]|uniref:hypothetical protein n=1 Tax=Mycobacterium sp. PSTR-4-N TaxID=2917745 RepID=UPI001F156B26|nr:hypothetical protein [Mycobacterium sp. PSTR-4-N]MCG7593847.1 hypothetical protein [Mycobacterium sp. PSTR-4-N]